jgi:hypothetical protein
VALKLDPPYESFWMGGKFMDDFTLYGFCRKKFKALNHLLYASLIKHSALLLRGEQTAAAKCAFIFHLVWVNMHIMLWGRSTAAFYTHTRAGLHIHAIYYVALLMHTRVHCPHV